MKRSKAFTLIELLIVLIIIAILVAVSWVFYSEYAASAKIRCSKENHKTMINYTSEVVTLCKLTSTVSLLDKNGNTVSRDCSDGTGLWDNYMREHFVGEKFSNCYKSSQQMPKGVTRPPTEEGVTHYYGDGIKSILIQTCFKLPCSISSSPPTAKHDVVYWTP